MALILHTGEDRLLDVTKDSVEIFELNDVYRESNGKYFFSFRQAILRDSDGKIIDWRMWKQNESRKPDKPYPGRKWVIWIDGIHGFRVIEYKLFIHTKTNYDDEVESMQVIPRERRKGIAPGLRTLPIY